MSMVSLEVPEAATWPDQAAKAVDVVSSADYLLTRLLAHELAILHAEYDPALESITWFIETRDVNGNKYDTPIATSRSLGLFRAVLARFGAHYMDRQLYNGFSLKFLRQRDTMHRCLIYLSNLGQSGFWIRIYVGALEKQDGTSRN